jgi:hypothetical protein
MAAQYTLKYELVSKRSRRMGRGKISTPVGLNKPCDFGVDVLGRDESQTAVGGVRADVFTAPGIFRGRGIVFAAKDLSEKNTVPDFVVTMPFGRRLGPE